MRDLPALPCKSPADCSPNRLRQKTHFANRLKQIPPVQPLLENISVSFFQK
jgi:hypothetical protein